MSLASLPLSESSKDKGNDFWHECDGKWMAGLVLAAPAYFIPSQGHRNTHCLLRSAALSASGTVCGKGTEVDLAKK